tara:strand:- start:1429 stop:2169 length:741 start_codon:yes stop_codon:yes gene_type:complete
MKACVIIPARYQSSRFPGKPLAEILGKPMILWVSEIAEKAVGKDNVYIATDDIRICEIVNKNGYSFILTSDSALTGTDRVAEASKSLNYDIIINVQGDEPLILPEDIIKCIQQKEKYPNFIINAYNNIKSSQDPINTNIPKVITNESDFLIYISRSLIPGFKDPKKKSIQYKKQVCIYAYNNDELNNFLQFGRKSKLEELEDIEILRFLEFKSTIKMFKSSNESIAVDVIEDVKSVENELIARNKF